MSDNSQATGGGNLPSRPDSATPGAGGHTDVLPDALKVANPLTFRAGPGEQTAVPAGAVPNAGAAGDVTVSPAPGGGGSSNQAGLIPASHRPGTARGSRAFGRRK
jgi:hypothetical protein